jgi:hypothetical protein
MPYIETFSTRMFSKRMSEIRPVVLEFDFMRAPFSELSTTEFVKDMFVTLLSIYLVSTVSLKRKQKERRWDGLTWLSAHRADGEAMASVAVHVVDDNVVSASNSYAVVLVDNNRIAELGVVGWCQVEAIAVVRSRQAVGTLVGRIASTVVQGDLIDVQSIAVADAETMDWVVLDIDVMNRTRSENLGKLDEVVGLRNTTITPKPIPPALTVAIQDGALCGGDLDVGTSDLDEYVVGISILPEGLSLEGHFGPSFQLREINGGVSRNSDAIEGDGSASRRGSRNRCVLRHIASVGGRSRRYDSR